MPSHQHMRVIPTDPQASGHAPVLKVKTHLKAGGLSLNHNETLVQAPPATALRVKTRIKAGYQPGSFPVLTNAQRRANHEAAGHGLPRPHRLSLTYSRTSRHVDPWGSIPCREPIESPCLCHCPPSRQSALIMTARRTVGRAGLQ
jgi:hypothetical protein